MKIKIYKDPYRWTAQNELLTGLIIRDKNSILEAANSLISVITDYCHFTKERPYLKAANESAERHLRALRMLHFEELRDNIEWISINIDEEGFTVDIKEKQ